MSSNLEQILNCLREANAEGTIVDTIWMNDHMTLFSFIESCIETEEEAALTQQQEAEPVAWFTEDHTEDKSATTYDPEVAERWRAKGWPVTALYLHPPKPAAPPQVPEGYALTPIEPADGLLISMACRDRHDFGLLSRGMQESIMGSMRQVHQEVVGAGFYNPDKEAEYKSMLSAAKEEGE